LGAAKDAWTLADGFPSATKYTVNFERATADFDSSRSAAPLVLYGEGKAETIEVSKVDGFVGELSYFVECVRTKTKPDRVTADDAVVGLSIIEAEKRSIETGKVEMI
jgi:predicted dehydrogenase